MCLAASTGNYFLDEPTSGVDPISRRHFWHFIKQLTDQGVTVFVTTHYMDEARHCHWVVMINEGRIVAGGTPREIIRACLPDKPNADLNDAFFLKLMNYIVPATYFIDILKGLYLRNLV